MLIDDVVNEYNAMTTKFIDTIAELANDVIKVNYKITPAIRFKLNKACPCISYFARTGGKAIGYKSEVKFYEIIVINNSIRLASFIASCPDMVDKIRSRIKQKSILDMFDEYRDKLKSIRKRIADKYLEHARKVYDKYGFYQTGRFKTLIVSYVEPPKPKNKINTLDITFATPKFNIGGIRYNSRKKEVYISVILVMYISYDAGILRFHSLRGFTSSILFVPASYFSLFEYLVKSTLLLHGVEVE